MKKFIIILLVFSLKGYSQDLRLFEHTWYLHDLVIDGVSNIPPVNDEIPYVPADFYENGFLNTGMCDEFGKGQLEYFGTTEFDVLGIVFLQGGCIGNPPYNQMYSSLYQHFWGDLSESGLIPYEIIEDGQIQTLIITDPNGDHAIYGNEILLSRNDISKSEFLIYPTVVKTSFYISSSSVHEIQKITIYNTFGQIVLISDHQQSEIDVSNLPAGIYLVSIKNNDDKITTKKIIKI